MDGREKDQLKHVITVKVNHLGDIARMAASVMTLGQPMYIIRFKLKEKHVYGILAVFRDYYNYYGLPMFYYYVDEDNKYSDARYILLRADESGEHLEIGKGSRAGWVSIPVIDLKEKPVFIPEEII